MKGFTQQEQQSYAEHQLDLANKGHKGLGFKKATTATTQVHGKHTALNQVGSSTFRVLPSKKQQQEKLKKLYPAIYDFLVFCELDDVAKAFVESTEMVCFF